jgi:hypothetical protein
MFKENTMHIILLLKNHLITTADQLNDVQTKYINQSITNREIQLTNSKNIIHHENQVAGQVGCYFLLDFMSIIPVKYYS